MSSVTTERRSYTEKDKQRALRAYHSRGDRSVAEVVAECGCAVNTFYRWLREEQEAKSAITLARPSSPSVVPSKPEPIQVAVAGPADDVARERDRLRVEVAQLRRRLANMKQAARTFALEMPSEHG